MDFNELVGMRLVQRGGGKAAFELDLRAEHCNMHGTLHGGVSMALLDRAGLWVDGEGDVVPRGTTAALNCVFLRGARLGEVATVRASAELVRRGRALFFASISLHALPGDTLLATAQGVYALPSAPPPTTQG